ncbi:YopX family protein [Bacillus subtilis]|uniref:YopX family protein n=1 Tax=Bacillus subtilis TaxID=1423 RepID=UPI0031F4B41B
MNTAYRVWDGEKMHYWDDGELSLIITGGEWGLYRNVVGALYPIRIASSTQKNATLMWGTGFFDYGVIYQEDIIKGKRVSNWHDGYDKVLGKIEFSKDTHGFYVEGMGAGPLYSIEPNFELLGDVYQNPELLEGAE